MNQFMSMVQRFHSKFGLDTEQRQDPGLPPNDLLKFRVNFLLEELIEYAQAIGFELVKTKDGELEFAPANNAKVSTHDALDALVDLEYVLHGTALFHGFGVYRFDPIANTRLSIFEAAFIRVHQANMTKVRAPASEASRRKSVFDVIKPAGWKPARFDDLLDPAQ